MTVSSLPRFASLAAFAVVLSIASAANAGTMFTVTDLGNSYSLQQDSTGTVHSVTSGDGSQTYAFEKSPVTQINSTVINPPGAPDSHLVSTTYLFQVGTDKIGYYTYQIPGQGQTNTPIGFLATNGWTIPLSSPISDVNVHGEIVGTGNPNNTWGLFAAFSSPSGNTHNSGYSSLYTDNLNTYIASDLGINLTSAIKIDDLGDIIAAGTIDGKNQYFLLSINGQPTPAPEPSTLGLLAVGITGLGIASARRRRELATIDN